MIGSASKKIEAFELQVADVGALAKAKRMIEGSSAQTVFPDKTPFSIPLAQVVEVSESDKPLVLVITPKLDGLDAQATRWCEGLGKLPPKSLPRSQRPILKILPKVFSPDAVGPMAERGRRMILNEALKSIWPAVRNQTEQVLAPLAPSATP